MNIHFHFGIGVNISLFIPFLFRLQRYFLNVFPSIPYEKLNLPIQHPSEFLKKYVRFQNGATCVVNEHGVKIVVCDPVISHTFIDFNETWQVGTCGYFQCLLEVSVKSFSLHQSYGPLKKGTGIAEIACQHQHLTQNSFH